MATLPLAILGVNRLCIRVVIDYYSLRKQLKDARSTEKLKARPLVGNRWHLQNACTRLLNSSQLQALVLDSFGDQIFPGDAHDLLDKFPRSREGQARHPQTSPTLA